MSKKCFIICSIGEDQSPTRVHADKVYKYLIKPVCDQLDIELIRADLLFQPTKITDDIFNHLDNDTYVIADLSELNANVFIEVGYRLKTTMPMILIKDINSTNSYPFDIAQYRVMPYSIDIDKIDKSKENLLEYFSNTKTKKHKLRVGTTYSGKPVYAKDEYIDQE